MTRKDYKAIAKAINMSTIITRKDITYIDKDLLIDDLCYIFKSDNGLFDRYRFIDACNDME